jgi:predicted membrane protein
LLEADFLYNVAEWKPVVKYEVNGRMGKLTIEQPHYGTGALGATRNEWNLSLNETVPMSLRIEAGVGKSNFELGGLDLTGLDIRTGVGEATVDLLGRWRHDVEASIKGGIGQVTLRLPDKVGVWVEVEKAIGSIHANSLRKEGNTYVNDAFGKANVTLRLHVQAGIGEIRLDSGG